jgi:hypothetical protein
MLHMRCGGNEYRCIDECIIENEIIRALHDYTSVYMHGFIYRSMQTRAYPEPDVACEVRWSGV